MRIVDLIRKKRDGGELTRDEIAHLVSSYTRDEVPDYQVAAFLMAALLKKLSPAETAALTEAMLHSGEVLDHSNLPAAKVDKHSTGGVGDKTSLVLAPLVAAGGLVVPMISGRGLGHTGGTLDKLEAIPGFNVNLSLGEFRRLLKEIGVAMIGQTAEIAPADKKLYALRDVTGTVESPYLICASIMSKKLAEGIDALVLDVKTGSGAFMKTKEESVFLAGLMVEAGERMGKRVAALITDMDQPLGNKVGNALEVEECVDIMMGGGPQDLRELTIELAAWMFYLGHRSSDVQEGRHLASSLIANGAALERFRQMVAAHGGDPKIVDDRKRLPQAAHTTEYLSPRDGFVQAIQCEQVGIASLLLGGGRDKKEDSIDHAVGLTLHKKAGEWVRAGDSLCAIHYNSAARLEEARNTLAASYTIGDSAPPPRPLVHQVISGKAAAADV